MRSIQVFIIVLCGVAGLYLSTGIGFFLPDRWHPETGVLLGGLSARLLGAGLLVIAATGIIALKHFAPGQREPYNPAWHRRYFLLLITAIALISAALWLGERGPTPGWRGPERAGKQHGSGFAPRNPTSAGQTRAGLRCWASFRSPERLQASKRIVENTYTFST